MGAALLALTPSGPGHTGCRVRLNKAAGRRDYFATCSVHGRVRVSVAVVEQSIRRAAEQNLPADEAIPCPGPWRSQGVVAGPWGRG
jgi:hypothetical protein